MKATKNVNIWVNKLAIHLILKDVKLFKDMRCLKLFLVMHKAVPLQVQFESCTAQCLKCHCHLRGIRYL